MKISEVTIEDLKSYLKIQDNDEIELLNVILDAGKAYIQNYTGLTSEQIDAFDNLTIAMYVLCADMYENRIYHVRDDNVNKAVQTILGMHSINLL